PPCRRNRGWGSGARTATPRASAPPVGGRVDPVPVRHVGKLPMRRDPLHRVAGCLPPLDLVDEGPGVADRGRGRHSRPRQGALCGPPTGGLADLLRAFLVLLRPRLAVFRQPGEFGAGLLADTAGGSALGGARRVEPPGWAL